MHIQMGWVDLARHTWLVIIGTREAQLPEFAQSVGPKDGLEFLNGLFVISVCMGILSYVLRILGRRIGKVLGMKPRKAQSFAGIWMILQTHKDQKTEKSFLYFQRPSQNFFITRYRSQYSSGFSGAVDGSGHLAGLRCVNVPQILIE